MDHKLEEHRREQIRQFCVGSELLFDEKNRIYNDAFSVTGLVGTVAQIIGIAVRLHAQVLLAPDHGRKNWKSIVEQLQDLHNYAAMSAMMVWDENYEGEIPPHVIQDAEGAESLQSASKNR